MNRLFMLHSSEGLVPPPEPFPKDYNKHYTRKAKAIYAYQANAADSDELSLSRVEILQVGNTDLNWWTARKENGETGIIPSNYMLMLDEAGLEGGVADRKTPEAPHDPDTRPVQLPGKGDMQLRGQSRRP